MPQDEQGFEDTAVAHDLYGHRDRLRQRARKGGLEALPDYEVLELFLFRTFPRGDVKPRAKALLTRFGDMAGVLGASLDELQSVAGIGEAAALDLKLMQEGALRQMRAGLRKRTVISSCFITR